MNTFEVVMLVMQVGASATALYNRQGMKALYWFGALLLTVAVIRGFK